MRDRTESTSSPQGSVSNGAGCSREHPAHPRPRNWARNVIYGVEEVDWPVRLKAHAVAALGETTGALIAGGEELWRRRRRLPLMGLLFSLLAFTSCGCGMMSGALSMAGMREITPRRLSEETGPVLEAYANEARTRVAVKYATEQGRDRWVNICSADVRRELRRLRQYAAAGRPVRWTPLLISSDIIRRCSSWRPRWKLEEMKRLLVVDAPTAEHPPHREELGVYVKHLRHSDALVSYQGTQMDYGRDGELRPILFMLERHRYRTAWGQGLQVLAPAAYVADLATCPIQFFIIMSRFGY